MQQRISHTSPAQWPPIKAGRFAALLHTDSPRDCAIALLGLPDDTGVRLNHGRAGAAVGPSAFRAALASYGTNWDGFYCRTLDSPVFDAGDVQPVAGGSESAMLETHARIEKAVGEVHKLGLLPVCIGGGHDLSLPSITAMANHAGGSVGGINFDAHLDVRSTVGSGMAFRRLIDGGQLNPRRFVEVGLGQFSNDERDVRWLAEQGAQLVFDREIVDRQEPDLCNAAITSWLKIATCDGQQVGFCSIDLDAIRGADAPGVSAANPLGLEVRDAAMLAHLAGAHAQIRHFDLMELCPPHDQDGRTARVAALLFLSFISGWKARLA